MKYSYRKKLFLSSLPGDTSSLLLEAESSDNGNKKSADWRGYATCFTCRREFPWQELHAGHYRHNKLDLEPLNIHPQCIRCNRWLHGNLGSYSLWLIRTYGPDILETIDRLEREWKPLTSEELQAIYLKYKQLNSQNQ